ncbi:MAG: cohesin domain-containing protein, partial [Candidatus Desantisbacteria bacterium]
MRGKGVGTTSLLYDFTAPCVTKMIDMEGKDIPFNYNEPVVSVSESQNLLLTIISGNNQQGETGEELPQPLTVRLSDGAGDPISGEAVVFAIDSIPVGAIGQALSNTSATTDSDGLASTYLTLGNKAGTYSVSATSQGLSAQFYEFAKESATSATFLRILPSAIETTLSSTFTLSLYIEDVKNFSVGELYLSFDPALLSVESITQGDFPAGGWMMKAIDNLAGKVDVGFGINPMLSPQEGSGTVAKLIFLAKSDGIIKLGFNQEEPRRTKILSPEEEIPYQDSGSTITIISTQTASTIVRINPEVTYAISTFTVALTINDVQDLMGASLKIGFDPNKLNACSVIEGDFLKQNAQTAFFTKIGSDYIQIDTVRLSGNPPGVTGTGTVATITFGLKTSDPSSTLTLTSILRDPANKDISHTDRGGLVKKGMLGDFDTDGDLDFEDLMLFSLAWNNNDLGGDIGPAEGTPPHLTSHPDGVDDFEDLMV